MSNSLNNLLSFFQANDETVEIQPEEDGYVLVSKRLNAWWDAAETPDPEVYSDPALKITLDETVRDHFEDWGVERVKIAEAIWGQGFINPGAGDFARQCLEPTRLNTVKQAMDLTAGLGGTAVMLAREGGVRIDAFEPNTSLFSNAIHLIASTPVSSLINLKQVDFHNLKIAPEKYDLIYSRERLFASQFKAEIIKQVAAGLRQNGRFVLTDYVIMPGHEEKPEALAWSSSELQEIHPWTTQAYVKEFESHGLLVADPTDLSEIIVEEISSAWRRMLNHLENGTIDSDMVNNVVVEGQIWQARIKALRAGQIKLMRFNVVKKGD